VVALLTQGRPLEARASYRRPPNEPAAGDGETLLHRERWLDPDNGRAIGWSVQVDPGDDAQLFRFEVIDTFETLGEDMFSHYMAWSATTGWCSR
jgi:hypothetical protein